MPWLLVSLSCGEPETRTLIISTHQIASCGEDHQDARLTLQPLGDYASVPSIDLDLQTENSELPIPAETRAFEARLSPGDGSHVSIGYAERGAGSDVPILLWPSRKVCRLGPVEGSSYPWGESGQGIGYSPAAHTLLLAGTSAVEAASLGALSFDTGSGQHRVFMNPGQGGVMNEARAFATVTPFGGRLLVAGGEDPLRSDGSLVLTVSETAEVFDPVAGAFLPHPIALSVGRTRHAAVVLPSGDTLLLGGQSPFGLALNVLELVSPDNELASLVGLARLQIPRLSPVVLPLEDGRVFIGGGTAADRTPISALEWISADARAHVRVEIPDRLPQRHDRAFVAMPGGGVLIVGGCAELRGADDLQTSCSECRNGCVPIRDITQAPEYDAWWVTPDYVLSRLEFPILAPQPVLFGGADGEPLLSPGDPSNRQRVFRFDPWSATFEEEPDLEFAQPPRAGLPAIALDSQAFVWLSQDDDSQPALFGLRIGTRNRFGAPGAERRDRGTLSLVPDRPVGLGDSAKAVYDGETLSFVEASDVRVFVAGVDFSNFELELELAPGSATPRLVLTSVDRPGPLIVEVPEADANRLRISRRANRLLFEHSASKDFAGVPSGRVGIGFAAGNGVTTLTRISIKRTR